MIDIVKTYIKFILLYRFNKIPKEGIELISKHWINKPKNGFKKHIYNKIMNKNK